ncbi:MAG: hypothetical protein JNM50_11975 [Chromatiales bacterium]|jgi:hypothetical protein|nr:hypothetical protein [Chromatiales bacterium]
MTDDMTNELNAAREKYRENLARAAAGDAEAQRDRPRIFAELRAAEDRAREAEDFERAALSAARQAALARDHDDLVAAVQAAREAAGDRETIARRVTELVGEIRSLAASYDGATRTMLAALGPDADAVRFPAKPSAEPLAATVADAFGPLLRPLNLGVAGSFLRQGWPALTASENERALTVLNRQIETPEEAA